MESIRNAVRVDQGMYYNEKNGTIDYYYTGGVASCIALWLKKNDGKTFFAHLLSAGISVNKKGSKDTLLKFLKEAGKGIAVFNRENARETTRKVLAFIKECNNAIAIKESISGTDILIDRNGQVLNAAEYNVVHKNAGPPANEVLTPKSNIIDVTPKIKTNTNYQLYPG